MQKTIISIGHTQARLAVLAAIVAACNGDSTRPLAPSSNNTPTALQSTGAVSNARDRLIHWETLSDDSLWAAIARSDSIADVGLKFPTQRYGMDARGRVLLSVKERGVAAQAVREVADVQLLSEDALLPIARVRVRSVEALRSLRTHSYVSYVEPGAFVSDGARGIWSSGSSGCSVGAYAGPAGSTTIAPGDVVPWNYNYMGIPLAWNRVGGGPGVTIGIVDTGVDYWQPELNALFAAGMSTGRSFTKDATSASSGPAPWHDDCGHGTRMASVIGAPRNGQSIVGVAWQANLYSVRVDNDVLLTNVSATRLGIRSAATNAKIIAMAFGTVAYYSSIADEILYWYGYDKLFFAAAGTSFCRNPLQGVVTFPGNLSTVTTVTGLDPNGLIACNSHFGPEVDFAAYVDQPATGLASLGSQLAGFGGSSDATGVLAGIAALSLSGRPSATRADILGDLQVAAAPTGYRSPTIGWGAPNAVCAVRAMCTAYVNGPSLIQTIGTRSYTWTFGQSNSPGPFRYQWSTGETTPSMSRSISVWKGMTEYDITLSVTVTDLSSGATTSPITKVVTVRDPQGCPTCT